MDSEKLTRNYYSKFIRLPSTEALSVWVGIEFVLSILRSLSDGFGYALGFGVYMVLSFMALRKRIRTALAMTGMFGVVYLIVSFFPLVIPLSFGLFIPLYTYVMLIDYGDLSSPAISTATGFIPSLFTLKGDFLLDVAFYLAVGLFSYFYLIFINRRGRKITGIPSLNIVRPFLKAMSYRREEELEAFLERISTNFTTSILLLKLGDVVLVLPRLHYGMYGNVGSSPFPYQVEELTKGKMLIFHGPGSHELDCPSKRESMKVAKAISSAINEDKWTSLRPGGIASFKEDRFRFTTLLFDKISVSFSERPGFGIDDLPGGLWEEMLRTGNFLVDCHNESLKEEIGHRDERALKNFISRKRLVTGETKLGVGYGEAEIESGCEGICSRKVKALIIGDGKRRLLILYVFANNANEETGKLAKERFKDKFDHVILVTPDDHSCTGTSFGNLYTPVEACPAILNSFERAVENAESNFKEDVESKYMIISVRTKIIGRFISAMVEGLEQVGNLAMKTFWIPLIFPYLLLFLLLFGDYFVKL
ncbi:DUF2070 family protein [Metallosphaera tengchongensis]|uniref:DUF2070 family protein n=1 Tax=Metallosphaera tengchongensis TaxID=1532350 RepID=A0A6N0NUB5_9CREN|nr:DUF2070 family protein [Metallosphaera tengchongensis]QKR00484.1 DUF2070 family protein [Metallosphaera tengchongensis]